MIAKYTSWMLLELGYIESSPTINYEDNQAEILMTSIDKHTLRTHHIHIELFALKEWRYNSDRTLKYISGMIYNADVLTKPLG